MSYLINGANYFIDFSGIWPDLKLFETVYWYDLLSAQTFDDYIFGNLPLYEYPSKYANNRQWHELLNQCWYNVGPETWCWFFSIFCHLKLKSRQFHAIPASNDKKILWKTMQLANRLVWFSGLNIYHKLFYQFGWHLVEFETCFKPFICVPAEQGLTLAALTSIIVDILTLTVRGSTLVVGIWRL